MNLLGIGILLQLLGHVLGDNILALMGMTSNSHHIWNSVLLHELARRGHNLTILSVNLPRSTDEVPENVTYIYLERGYDMYKGQNATYDINSFINQGNYEIIVPFYEFGLLTARNIVKSQGFHQLLNYPDDFKFDLIINDYTLGPYLLGFAHKFNYPPIIGITAYHNPTITMDFMSNPYFPALVPYHTSTYSVEMNFLQRLDNTLIFALDTIYRRLVYNPGLDKIVRPFFSNDMPPLAELAKLTKISMINTHPALDYVEALPPNIIEIGGLQGKPSKPLPKDLNDFMSNVENGQLGSIFFSLGTNMQPKDVDKRIKLIILNAFRELPKYNIIWKFDENYLKDVEVPNNVLVREFLPQNDILGHASLRVFVTHCGGLSTQEATWHGVPIVGIPLFLDQHRNLRQSLNAGVARHVDYLTMTTSDLVKSISEVAESREILGAMKLRSKRFRDNPIQPLELAVWWVEYLLREPQPAHLESVATKLNYFQTHSLDVLAFIILLVYLPIRCLFGKTKRKLKTE